jgi:TrmH family RNA methyltransferase
MTAPRRPVPQPKAISSRSNPLWQRLRRLAQEPTAYRQLGEVWVEGEHLCTEVVAHGMPVQMAVLTEAAWQTPALRALAEAASSVVLLPAGLMAALSPLGSAPPLAMVLPWHASTTVAADAPSVVLDGLQDAGNVGTVLRSAAAFGFRQVIALPGTAALWSPKVLRAGMGAHGLLSLVEGVEASALDQLAVPLLATSSHAGAAIDRQALPWPCAWVFGHEGQGLSAAVAARCGQHVRIPQPGGLESLNVAAAASICFYESARQRSQAAGRTTPG